MGFSEKITRFRNSRGFGVHSPFAYLLARLVIRPRRGYAYYGYRDIDRAIRINDTHTVRHEARMLLRLLTRLLHNQPAHSGSIFLPHSSHPAFSAAVKAANSRLHIISKKEKADKALIIAASADTFPTGKWLDFILQPGKTLLIKNISEDLASQIFNVMPEGVMILGKKNIIAIHRPEMQKVSYLMDI